ncbi:MAG: hypothetical protein KDA78_06370 [Planctomycetaceae bacterium]|nr:hypothetical protein [Planctomycetaceae bacterium]
MIGRLRYQIQTRLQHGLRAAWYRDVVRSRILKTHPIEADQTDCCEIHVLTSANDWVNLLWALKSFYVNSGRRYGLCIHDDGSLNDEIRDQLRHHFPLARIISRTDSDRVVQEELKEYPRCLEFRKTNHLAPKVFDFRHELQTERMLLLDSDVLFYAEPKELLRRIEDPAYTLNSVNADVGTAYTVSPDVVQRECGFELILRFNSGLGVIHRDSLNLDWIEEFLGLPDVIGHFWRIEQTLYALCSSRFGVELLPEEYSVFLEGPLNDRPSRHYVGAIRHLMYAEGIAKLLREGFLQNLQAISASSSAS